MTLAAVLFDFDGTLVDTRSASWPLFARTNRKFGLGIDTRAQFFALFEDNFYSALTAHCADSERATAAAEHFMELVRRHYNPPFIRGVEEVVRRLVGVATLGIVSSNKRETIERILIRAGLVECFEVVLAGDVEASKSAAIRGFLAGASAGWRDARRARRFSPATVVLVTDTCGDVKEAGAGSIDAWGVSWGMHTADQLRAAGALRVVTHPKELWTSFIEKGINAEGGLTCRPTT